MTLKLKKAIEEILRIFEINNEKELLKDYECYSLDNELINLINEKDEELIEIKSSLTQSLGFIFKNEDLKNIIQDLEYISNKKEELYSMYDAWDSEDDCEMACNDPGLQYELEETLDKLIINIKFKYQKSDSNVKVN